MKSNYLLFRKRPYYRRYYIGVYNAHNNMLIGNIKWHPRWRKYVFSPDECTFYDYEHLKDITEYIKGLEAERYIMETTSAETEKPSMRLKIRDGIILTESQAKEIANTMLKEPDRSWILQDAPAHIRNRNWYNVDCGGTHGHYLYRVDLSLDLITVYKVTSWKPTKEATQ